MPGRLTDPGRFAGSRPLIYFIVGEPSGDQIGGHLIRALKEQTDGAVEFGGIGGPAMAAAGLESLFPIDLFSVMGLDYVPRLCSILRRMKQLERDIALRCPDCVVTIDAQALSGHMGRRLARRGETLVHYVAPTVWAWRPGRAQVIARRLTHLLTIFPFEASWFEPLGLPVTFVGHPAAEPDPPDPATVAEFRQRHAGAGPVLCLLPGSRRKEVRRQLPIYRAVIERLKDGGPPPVCLMPTVESVRKLATALTADWPAPLIPLPADDTKYLAFLAADAALAASGTVTVELAIAGTPTVVTYNLPWLEGKLARLLVNTPLVSAVNIAAGEAIMPELLLEQCRPEPIANALAPLLRDPALRRAQATRIRAVAQTLSVPGRKPSEIAADAILRIILEKSCDE
ncbi:MAG: lipid-A-disaccharide synthase [Rhodospirillaceae bacterium]|nr:lipid-A-disaccharide synthase [Rhodospirillaceae bacterium]